MKNIVTIEDAQRSVKEFTRKNKWKDVPNIDKFDHLHEELIEMSRLIRYKTEKERIRALKEHKDEFVDGIGDLFFALCRLANQLDVDITIAFSLAAKEIINKYKGRRTEYKNVSDKAR